jgi:Mn-dependent DtxR family transcriptional regulator
MTTLSQKQKDALVAFAHSATPIPHDIAAELERLGYLVVTEDDAIEITEMGAAEIAKTEQT